MTLNKTECYCMGNLKSNATQDSSIGRYVGRYVYR